MTSKEILLRAIQSLSEDECLEFIEQLSGKNRRGYALCFVEKQGDNGIIYPPEDFIQSVDVCGLVIEDPKKQLYASIPISSGNKTGIILNFKASPVKSKIVLLTYIKS